MVDGKLVRRPIEEAKKLLAEAGYPDGRDAKTGKPLVLNYDFQRAATPELRRELDWMVKQFAKLGVQLEIRATDYNQFQDKMRKGKHQIFWWGWLADYPDAENFLFLLYGPNCEGEVATARTPRTTRTRSTTSAIEQMQLLDDGPEKQKLIDQMIEIVQQDAPWSFGYFPYVGRRLPAVGHNGKPSDHDPRPYRLLPHRPGRCARGSQAEWNKPVWWPLAAARLAAAARWRASCRRAFGAARAASAETRAARDARRRKAASR